ncbi:MAG: hypothetical protein JW750_08370 [Anaerolineaceae bacterium]|nr:hypothetical protein [Anaerolineaceae bacterium]
MEKVSYKGWENCYKLSNGKIELIITTDVGPRIIFFGFAGGENMFKNYDEMMGSTGGDEWMIYGGHRLWHAPEAQPRSYIPDNFPVKIEDKGDFVRVTQPVEALTGIQKEIDIYLDETDAHVKLIHRLTNHGLWGVELSVWALSVMAPGGKAIIPLPPRGTHGGGSLLPESWLTLWPYTDMADSRWHWGTKYIMLQSEEGNEKAQKVGGNVPDSWAAYANKNQLFVKHFDYMPDFLYPDNGCCVETFTNEAMLELETLSPMSWLEPGEASEHVEHWALFNNVPLPQTEADVDQYILPLVKTEETID